MLASKGPTIPPCGDPAPGSVTTPSSSTPALRNPSTSRSTLPSATLSPTSSMRRSRGMESSRAERDSQPKGCPEGTRRVRPRSAATGPLRLAYPQAELPPVVLRGPSRSSIHLPAAVDASRTFGAALRAVRLRFAPARSADVAPHLRYRSRFVFTCRCGRSGSLPLLLHPASRRRSYMESSSAQRQPTAGASHPGGGRFSAAHWHGLPAHGPRERRRRPCKLHRQEMRTFHSDRDSLVILKSKAGPWAGSPCYFASRPSVSSARCAPASARRTAVKRVGRWRREGSMAEGRGLDNGADRHGSGCQKAELRTSCIGASIHSPRESGLVKPLANWHDGRDSSRLPSRLPA